MRRPLSRELSERLFEGNGPLASFSNKILMAHGLSLYGEKFRHDIDLIRELRNGFAHCRHAMTLQTPEVAQVCDNLLLPDDEDFRRAPLSYVNLHPDPRAVADPVHPRTRFTTACHTASVWPLDLEQQLLNDAPPVSLP
jgi:hypothetical protein